MPETLTGESRGLAKGEAARRVCAPVLGEEKATAAFWEGGGHFDRSSLPGPLLELAGQPCKWIRACRTPSNWRFCRATMRRQE